MDIAVPRLGAWEAPEEAFLLSEAPSCLEARRAEADRRGRPRCCEEGNAGRSLDTPWEIGSCTAVLGPGRTRGGPCACRHGRTAARGTQAGRRAARREASAGLAGRRRGPSCCTSCAGGPLEAPAAAVRDSLLAEGARLAEEDPAAVVPAQAEEVQEAAHHPAEERRMPSCCCSAVAAAAAAEERVVPRPTPPPPRATLTAATRMIRWATGWGGRQRQWRQQQPSCCCCSLPAPAPADAPVRRWGRESSDWIPPRPLREHRTWS